jgi:hypothetical protein
MASLPGRGWGLRIKLLLRLRAHPYPLINLQGCRRHAHGGRLRLAADAAVNLGRYGPHEAERRGLDQVPCLPGAGCEGKLQGA